MRRVSTLLAAAIAVSPLQGCAGCENKIQHAAVSGLLSSVSEQVTFTQRCRDVLSPQHAPTAELAELTLLPGISLGDPALLTEQLTLTIRGSVNADPKTGVVGQMHLASDKLATSMQKRSNELAAFGVTAPTSTADWSLVASQGPFGSSAVKCGPTTSNTILAYLRGAWIGHQLQAGTGRLRISRVVPHGNDYALAGDKMGDRRIYLVLAPSYQATSP